MCGICGIAALAAGDTPALEPILQRMIRVMHHRGPDDQGIYLDRATGLGMTRLSIIDLPTGHQPMANEDGTIWTVFNGEIYNYRSLRADLVQQGHTFATASDTEAIVHAYEAYGEDCVSHFNGMFAFALWDAPRQRLLLARDRLGIKPLYYGLHGSQLIFGSELKALLAHPGIPRTLDLVALDQFLTLEYIPSPRTIFQGLHKLPPGHLLVLEAGQHRVTQYWDVRLQPVPESEDECVEALRSLLQDAVRLQMVSDVPLGAFLSGGIDSSTVVALMSQVAIQPVRTFSIGFEDRTYNELPYARAVAAHFDTVHTEAFLEPDISALVEQLVPHLDEPFADFSVFPTYLVSQLARQQVKVVLSGDGGDEVFGGYDTYVAQNLALVYGRLPAAVRRDLMPAVMSRIAPRPEKKGVVNKAKRFVEGAALPAALQHTRWMTFMSPRDKAALYQPGLQAALDGATPQAVLEGYFQRLAHAEPLAQQQYVDLKTYLVDDILVKVDRMSMAHSLEARVPLLDHRIVEFALSLPTSMKLRRGRTKVILRRAMAGLLPPEVLQRPKQGFSIPLKHWLGGPLYPLMVDLLSPASVRRRGLFQPGCVQGWMQEHLQGKANHSHRLWALMVLELWQRQTMDP